MCYPGLGQKLVELPNFIIRMFRETFLMSRIFNVCPESGSLFFDIKVSRSKETLIKHVIHPHRSYRSWLLQVRPGGDMEIQHQVLLCTSPYSTYFQITIYAYKGLLLAFGAFLAWETRKVGGGGGMARESTVQGIGMLKSKIAIIHPTPFI